MCPVCDRRVDLDQMGHYRRHFASTPGGRRRLCVSSGCRAEGVVRLLEVEPTHEERYSHALRLLAS
jgi:hypothetical protein